MKSYPNQKVVTIHKAHNTANFLQVDKADWMEAYARLSRKGSFGLYLYLCGNKDNYNFALSSAAVQQALQVSDSTYRRAIDDLLAEGYLIMRNDNEHTLDFYTTPQSTTYVKKEHRKKTTEDGNAAAEPVIYGEPPLQDSTPSESVLPHHHDYSPNLYQWSD